MNENMEERIQKNNREEYLRNLNASNEASRLNKNINDYSSYRSSLNEGNELNNNLQNNSLQNNNLKSNNLKGNKQNVLPTNNNNLRIKNAPKGNLLNYGNNKNNNGTISRINNANRKSQSSNLTNTLATKGLESVGVPPGVSDKIVNSKVGQKAINEVKENVPGLSALDSLTSGNKPEPGEQGEGFQNLIVPKKVKKIALISMIPILTLLVFCCLLISAQQIILNVTSLGDADSLTDSEIESKIDKKGDEGLDEEKSDEDVYDNQENSGGNTYTVRTTYTVRGSDSIDTIAKKYNTTVDALMELNNLSSRNDIRTGMVLKIPNDDVAYSNISTNNIIFMTKFNESNLLVANYSGRKYNEADIEELEDFYPAVSSNNTNLAYDFFYKMYNLNKYYADLCNKNIIDLPLLMSTLRIQYEDTNDVFKANLDDEDTKSYKRKQPVEEYKYDYDWSNTNYISTKTVSTHDMEILVQHMINVEKTDSGFKCTLDSKNYKEFLKEFIENKYYLNGYKPGKPENYTTGNMGNEDDNTDNDDTYQNSQSYCENCTEFTSKFITWLLKIANDNSHGYAQDSRVGKPDYDCSSLVYYGLLNNGFSTKQIGSWPFNTRSENEKLTKSGFKKIQFTNIDSLEPGDILLRTGHTEVYIGKNLCVGAHINEKGGISNGQPGDQTGDEISVQNCSKNWLWAYRYKG